MLRSMGASTQPCFTPLLIGNGSEVEPSYWTVPSWKTLSSFVASVVGASNPLQEIAG